MDPNRAIKTQPNETTTSTITMQHIIYNSEDDNKENITQKVISLMALIKHCTVYIKSLFQGH